MLGMLCPHQHGCASWDHADGKRHSRRLAPSNRGSAPIAFEGAARPMTLFPASDAGVAIGSAAPESVRWARVAVFVPLSQAYTFSVPATLSEQVVSGARVVCAFRGRQLMGVVLSVGDGPPDVPIEKLKPILTVVDTVPVVPAELLGLACELASYYLAPIGEVMRLAVPAFVRTRARGLSRVGLLGVKRA